MLGDNAIKYNPNLDVSAYYKAAFPNLAGLWTGEVGKGDGSTEMVGKQLHLHKWIGDSYFKALQTHLCYPFSVLLDAVLLSRFLLLYHKEVMISVTTLPLFLLPLLH